MTPSEKAREIYESFHKFCAVPVHENKKQCALIHVDGLINEAAKWSKSYMGNKRTEFLNDVKKEIEKL